MSPLVAGCQHGVLLGASIWLEQPSEVEDGGVVHKDVQPRPLDHPSPHVVLYTCTVYCTVYCIYVLHTDIKLLPEVDLVEPSLLPAHWLALLHSVGLEQVQQIEKLLLI